MLHFGISYWCFELDGYCRVAAEAKFRLSTRALSYPQSTTVYPFSVDSKFSLQTFRLRHARQGKKSYSA